MDCGEASLMGGTSTDNFHPKGHAGAALLEAGQARATAPLFQRRLCHVDPSAGQSEMEGVTWARTETHPCVCKEARVTRLIKARFDSAVKLWIAVAACTLLCFLALRVVWRVTGRGAQSDPPLSEDPLLEEQNTSTEKKRIALGSSTHQALHEALETRRRVHQAEPHYVRNALGEFEDDYQRKQHPDDPSFVDAWDGEEIHHLHLSRGVEGLKTPLYRLPFAEGQHNDTHAIGLHGQSLAIPRYLEVNGGHHMDKALGGSYTLMMIPDGRPKPLLVHGRPIWRRETVKHDDDESTGKANVSPYLFYDHTHHTWVFNSILDFQNPQPMAFLPHGALLPVLKSTIRTEHEKALNAPVNSTKRERFMRYLRHGVPASVHWIVREGAGKMALTADTSIRVTGHPGHLRPENFYTLTIQKVFHAREDDDLHEDEGEQTVDGAEDANFFDDDGEEEAEQNFSEDDSDELLQDDFPAHEEHHMDLFSLPASTKTRQHFLTHPLTFVYHTFEELHPRYPHSSMVQDPVGYLEKNPHPDIETVERQFGDDSTTVAHPLREMQAEA